MLHSGTLTPGNTNPTPLVAGLTTPGQTAYGSIFAAFILIQSRTGNTGSVKVTGQLASGAAATDGVALAAGEKILLPWIGAPHSYNLATTFVITNGTDAVDFDYGSV